MAGGRIRAGPPVPGDRAVSGIPLCLGSPGVGKGLMLPAQGQGLGREGDFCQIPVLAVPVSRAVTHAAPQEQMCEAR